jgi:uncharacterized protein YjcR
MKRKEPPRKEFSEDFEKGLSLRELGEKYGFSKQTATNYAKKWGLERKDPEWLEPLRNDYKEGYARIELARKYGLSLAQVRYRTRGL